MLTELILSWLLSLPTITPSQQAQFWKAELAVVNAQLQCEPCQAARVLRNKLITDYQRQCKTLALDFSASGDPVCVIPKSKRPSPTTE